MSMTKLNGVQASDFLEEAVTTMKKRALQRDTENERSMAKTVAIFNAWTGGSMTEADGWRFMICLKQAREIQGAFLRDDYVDLSAYAGLLGEHLSEKDPDVPTQPSQIHTTPIWSGPHIQGGIARCAT